MHWKGYLRTVQCWRGLWWVESTVLNKNQTSQELRMLSPSICIQRSQCNYSYCCSHCQKCNQCLECHVLSHKNFREIWKLSSEIWKFSANLKCFPKICQNWQKLSKLSKIVKIFKNCQNCQKLKKKWKNVGQVLFPHHSDQMSQRSQVSRVTL